MLINKFAMPVVVAMLLAIAPIKANANDVYQVQLYFGLSIPAGGVVTSQQWQNFVVDTIEPQFDGFNIVDSVGYWKAEPEDSKIVTIILNAQDLHKAEAIAQVYAKRFDQDSVMLVKTGVEQWEFISGSGVQ
ncbi:DUF3574 domain-containing protein [Vibrio sp. SCSIO 43136]|uniref:DUF3574 domain-containing protein n=1 Tax=Vibrio sp. SCSIO 43136 TaxID=2819101 RepID=UPI002075FD0F|nr:DUF3574 domain-containing protein [Vibrio sp. SCSIO 43136]USD66145.1 DUF3574 domain-containing protein [Vibrio sp. SCSIO 43136]